MRESISAVMERLRTCAATEAQELAGQLGLVLERSALGVNYGFDKDADDLYAQELPQSLRDTWLSPAEMRELADYLFTLISNTDVRVPALWSLSKAPSKYSGISVIRALGLADRTWDDDSLFQLLVAVRNVVTSETAAAISKDEIWDKIARLATNRSTKITGLVADLRTVLIGRRSR